MTAGRRKSLLRIEMTRHHPVNFTLWIVSGHRPVPGRRSTGQGGLRTKPRARVRRLALRALKALAVGKVLIVALIIHRSWRSRRGSMTVRILIWRWTMI